LSIGEIWLHFVVSPLTTGLVVLINLTGSAALGIVAFTLVTRVILLPLSVMQIRSQKKMLALQPQLKELQKRFGKDRERLMQEQMRLYKEHGVQPAMGCLPLALQMPILFGLYAALSNLAHYYNPQYGQYLTDFQKTAGPALLQPFLYLCNLAGPDGIPLHCGDNPMDPANFLTIGGIHVPGPMLLVMTVLSYVVQKMMVMPTSDPQQQQMNRMMAFMPLMYLFFFSTVPAGLVLYWLVTNLFSIVQQYFIAGRRSLFPAAAAAESVPPPTPALVEKSPEPNGAAPELPATERRAAASRATKRRKSGRR